MLPTVSNTLSLKHLSTKQKKVLDLIYYYLSNSNEYRQFKINVCMVCMYVCIYEIQKMHMTISNVRLISEQRGIRQQIWLA